jgi:membrane protease YdiL (CAAX protease family)
MKNSEIRWIITFLILGAVGLWAFLNNYDRAIPVASLDFKLSRDEAFLGAQKFAVSRGHDLGSFESAQIFAPDMMSQIFLQKSVGLEETNRLAREWISIFNWQFRWYKPLEKEEIHVHLDPGGRVVYYRHEILDEEEGANLTEAVAQLIAESFAFETQGFRRDEWKEVERSSEERTARTDHTFTYRKSRFTVGDDGHYRMKIVVQGDGVGVFDEFLHVPENFKRGFEKTRSQANLLTLVFSICWIALAIAVLVILAQRYRAGGLQWRSSTILGIAVLMAMMLAQLNSIPLIQYNYNTTQSTPSFFILIIMQVVVASVFTGGIVMMTGTAGGWIARDVTGSSRLFPRLSLRNLVSGRFVRSTLIGYGLAGMMLGFLILFYYIGTELFGVWSPAYVIEYDNAFSTAFPWAYPLLVGLVAAAQEEFFFRLLAVTLMLRWLKIRWLAVLIPAIVWGFLHSNYPVEPIYTRGIELTIVGTAFGYIFLRWGIWSTIVGHYAYNAFVTAFPMLRSSSLYFQISGLAVIGLLLVPVVVAGVVALRGRTGDAEEEEDPEQAAPTPDETVRDTASDTDPVIESAALDAYVLSGNQRLITVAISVISLAVIFLIDTPKFGRSTYNLTIDRADALEKAEAVRRSLGWDLEESHRYADYKDDLAYDGLTYLIRKVGIDRADSLVSASLHPRRWDVRWFRPLEKTEYRIGISDAGELATLRRLLPDSLAGAELGADEARQIAQTALMNHFSVDVRDSLSFNLIEAKSDKRESRLDHSFVWERLATKVDSGEFRVNATVQGDSFGGASFSFKAPESFLRDLHESGIKDAVVWTIQVVLTIAVIILGSITFFKMYREGVITWRVSLILGALVLAGGAIGQVNSLPLFFRGFHTSQSMLIFLGLKGVTTLMALVFLPLFIVVTSALAISLYRHHVSGHVGPVVWVERIRGGDGPGRLVLDSFLAGTALVLILRGFATFTVDVKNDYFLHYSTSSAFSLPWLDTYAPFVEGLSDVLSGIGGFFAVLVLVLVVKRYVGAWKWVLVLLLFPSVLNQIRLAQDWTHGFVIVAITIVQWLVVAIFLVKVVRFNLLAYFVAMVFIPLVFSGVSLLESSMAWYDANGIVVILLGLLPLWAGIYFAVRGREGGGQLTGA